MKRYSEAANRYAQAVFDLAQEEGKQEIVFQQLRQVSEAFEKNREIIDFFASPIVNAQTKLKAMQGALRQIKVESLVARLLDLLGAKNRLSLFPEIVLAFQDKADTLHGVIRGYVRSASSLQPEERSRIESIVSKVTHKKVILTYTQDQTLLGGLVAQVGSYTFDDSLDSHLHRIRDELKRRTH